MIQQDQANEFLSNEDTDEEMNTPHFGSLSKLDKSKARKNLEGVEDDTCSTPAAAKICWP
jgi:hypothetical protein